ncbi:MAG: hypothetical protein ACK5E4_03335 [Planctomycetia bacterium]
MIRRRSQAVLRSSRLTGSLVVAASPSESGASAASDEMPHAATPVTARNSRLFIVLVCVSRGEVLIQDA